MTAVDFMELTKTGCTLHAACGKEPQIERLRALCDGDIRVGQRLSTSSVLVQSALTITGEALASVIGLKPVRAVLFDKSPTANWLVPWHQDRTIAVRRRVDIPGYGPWSMKSGVVHVEPPFAILAEMLTVRLHLDDCPIGNAPLIVALGSHRTRIAARAASDVAQASPQRTCTARAGDLWIYATPILHRSDRAAMPATRRVVQIDFARNTLPEGLDWAE